VSTIVVKRSEILSNRVFIIIRRYVDNTWLFRLPIFSPYSSVSILYLCIWFYDFYASV